VLLLGRAIASGSGPNAFAGATLALAVAVFAYPTMSLPSAFALAGAGVALALRRDRADLARILAAISMVIVVCAAGVLAWGLSLGGFEALEGPRALNEAMAAQGGGLRKLEALAGEIWFERSFLVALLLWLNAMLFVVVRGTGPQTALVVCVLLGLLPWLLHRLYDPYTEPFTSAPFYWSGIACLAPFFVRNARERFSDDQHVAQLLVVAAGLFGGAVILWSTANGFRNAGLGLMPAALLGFALIVDELGARARDGSELTRAAGAVLVIALVGFQLGQLWQTSYRNGPVAELSVPVASGPWRGIRTTEHRAGFLRDLRQDLAQARGEARSWIVYDYLPGAYLLTELRPMTHTLWTFPGFCCQGTPEVREVYARRFDGDAERPELLLENRCQFIRDEVILLKPPPAYRRDDPLRVGLRAAAYRPTARHACYTIYTRDSDEPRMPLGVR